MGSLLEQHAEGDLRECFAPLGVTIVGASKCRPRWRWPVGDGGAVVVGGGVRAYRIPTPTPGHFRRHSGWETV